MNPIATRLAQLEHERCQALLAGDGERLKQLMHPDYNLAANARSR